MHLSSLAGTVVKLTRVVITSALIIVPLAGCASLPEVDPDLACTIKTPNEAASLAIMEKQGTAISGAPFVPGNLVTLLKNGPATYAALRQAIENAKTRIEMESYEFDGPVAQSFGELLLRKRSEGVTVRLIYDAWGSNDTPGALFDHLRKGGIQVVEYSPFDPAKMITLDINRRDHRKLLVVDGRIAITGGVNISQVYKNRRHGNNAADPDLMAWRDTDVQIEGPVVPDFERLFVETWRSQNGPPIADPPPIVPPAQGDSTISAIDGSPNNNHPAIYRTLLVAMSVARTSIHLTTGFFVPTPDLEQAFKCAARRGVDVRIVVPETSTSSLSVNAGRAQYTELLEAGVHIYERQHTVLHAKTAVIDGVWSAVGSSNLDWRSVVFNNEIDAIILGPHFGQQMEELFQHDEAESIEIDPAKWRHRPLGERLHEFGARIFDVFL